MATSGAQSTATLMATSGAQESTMANKSHTFISEINKDKKNYTLKVRIARIWTVQNKYNKRITALDMILMDEKGDEIHAKATDFKQIGILQRKLRKDDIYLISNFSVEETTLNPRPVQNKYILFLGGKTTFEIVLQDLENFPLAKFNFVDFSELERRDELLADVIGILAEWPIEKFTKAKNPEKIREITIVNKSGTKLNITLWGKFKDEFDEATLQKKIHTKPVLMVTMGKIGHFQGPKLSTTTATQMFLDLFLPETTMLKNSPIDVELKIGRTFQRGKKSNLLQVQDSINSEKHTEDYFICTAKIEKVMYEDEWYYMACKECNKRTIELLGEYQCSKCGPIEIENTFLLCKLQLHIKDETGTAKITCFGEKGQTLLRNSVSALINMQESGIDIEKEYLQALEGTEATFSLKVTTHNRQYKNGYLNCNEVTIEREINNEDTKEKEKQKINNEDNKDKAKENKLAPTTPNKSARSDIVDLDKFEENAEGKKLKRIKTEPED